MVESKKTEEENERRIGRVKEIRLEQEAMDELTKSVGCWYLLGYKLSFDMFQEIRVPWYCITLHSVADALSSKDLPIAMTFPISRGLADHNLDVCGRMINAGILIIDKHGKENVPLLLPIFESYLNKRASNEETCDLVREGVVIYWCSSKTSIEDVLNTPSEAVQRPVSDCLSPLMLSKQVLVDPIPEVLELLGSLIAGMGEQIFPDLVHGC
ncbi:Translational activator GCN1 [Hordeum vulgare]|nr:Translational activator GCN1 [Hordeum vulgare]